MKQSFLLALLFSAFSVTAQEFEISGRVVDQEAGTPLESATIFVEHITDSALVAYTISGRDGSFIIEGKDASDSLRLVTSYNGYIPLNQIIVLKPAVNMGNLSMKVATNELGEVMVVANRAPITVKSDTLEFNAGSFSTRPDANLEDVMKKLPGVEVDAQGNITVNGKPVSRILVNGKEFFGDDPKIATKNLPKEIIDKIQVVHTKTKSEEFTGKAGNPDDKTINITVKEDKSRGYFSRATAGGGTDERYELSAIRNYFKDDLRVSVLVGSNNINSAGFTSNEAGRLPQSISGNSFGSSGGITKSETAGFNYDNEWDEMYELNTDYFYGRKDTETRSIIQRKTFLPDRIFYTNSISTGNIVNDTHRWNGNFEVEIDSLTRISIQSSFQNNDGFSARSRSSDRLDEDDIVGSSATRDNEVVNNTAFNNRIDFIKRFGSRGAYVQLDFRNRNNWQENKNRFFSERLMYEDGILEDTKIRNQLIDEDNKTDAYNLGLTQRSVLAEKLFLDLSYEFNSENSGNVRNVYDYNDDTQSYSGFSEDLSNAFEVKSVKHIPNVGLNYEATKWRTSFNVGLLNTSLKNKNFIEGTSLDRNFNNLYLSSNVRYEVKRGTSLYLYYQNHTDIPSINQLQPVEDVTDPLNIVIGNPNLDPSFSHRFNLGYQNFDFTTLSGMHIYGAVTFTEDQVVPYTITGENLISTTTYANVDGRIDANIQSFYNKRIKKEQTQFSFRLGASAIYSRQIGFTNELKFYADRYRFEPSIRLGYNFNEMVEINPRYELGYVLTNYDITIGREEEYTNHIIGLEATTYWPKNIVFGNDIAYISYGSVAPGFDPTSMLWNMSLGYKFLDDDAALKVKVYDLLNENVSTRRTTGQNYVQDTQELILKQYVMLSLTYKLSGFGGKDTNKGEK